MATFPILKERRANSDWLIHIPVLKFTVHHQTITCVLTNYVYLYFMDVFYKYFHTFPYK